MKICTACNNNKEDNDFSYDKTNKRLKSYCKKCQTKKSMENASKIGSGSWWQAKYCRQKKRAKNRGYDFAMSLKHFRELKESKVCYYCEEDMGVTTIDRVDNEIHYTDENTVACCMDCNKIKGVLTEKQIINFYEKMRR